MVQHSTTRQLTPRDQQMLEAVRRQAAALGRMPSKQELVDYEQLRRRFGNWPNIMICAGLKQDKAARRAQNRERDLRNEEQRRLKKEACCANKP